MQVQKYRWSLVLVAIHLAAVIAVFARQSTDGQWQLAYLPFLFTDFPVSLFYRFLPPPFAEAVLGTAWWFAVPLGVRYLWSAYRRRSRPAA